MRDFAAEIFGCEAGVVADQDSGLGAGGGPTDVSGDGFGRETDVGVGELVCDDGAPTGGAELDLSHEEIITTK